MTSRQIALEAEADYMIMHATGYMFITDIHI